MADRFHYLSPIILPILPRAAGDTLFSLNMANALQDVAADSGDARLSFHIEQFERGKSASHEAFEIAVAKGIPAQAIVDRRFAADELSYVEISITAERPYFRKILLEHVYSIVERPDGGNFNLIGAFKFSDRVIINLMRRIGQFCLVHPAHFVAKARNIGNSVLIINPFDGPILARLATAKGRDLKRRIAPHQATMIPLQELIDDDCWTCVLYTGNNRYPAWDVRHVYDDPSRVNRIDHLEYYRGDQTVRRLTAGPFLRSKVRRVLRALGMRH